jgi:hypothetical protein
MEAKEYYNGILKRLRLDIEDGELIDDVYSLDNANDDATVVGGTVDSDTEDEFQTPLSIPASQ